MTNEKSETFLTEIFFELRIVYIIYIYFLVVQKTKTISYKDLVFRPVNFLRNTKWYVYLFYTHRLFFIGYFICMLFYYST